MIKSFQITFKQISVQYSCFIVWFRSLLGNASSADAGEVFLTITKNSAKNAVSYLEKYKASTGTGGAFSASSPRHQTLPHTSFHNNEVLPYALKIPPLFKNTGLLSDRAVDTIGRVEAFIAENVLPR